MKTGQVEQGRKRNVANVVDRLQNLAQLEMSATKDVREQANFVSCSPWSRAQRKVTSTKEIFINSGHFGRPLCSKSDERLVAVCEHLGRL